MDLLLRMALAKNEIMHGLRTALKSLRGCFAFASRVANFLFGKLDWPNFHINKCHCFLTV